VNAQAIAALYEGHTFFDPLDCFGATLAAARNRSKLSVRARVAGRGTEADRHRQMANDYMRQTRDFHDMIDWSDE
jgi:hypothetical protein